MIKKFILGVASFFFASAAFANPGPNHHNRHRHHMDHHGRYMERDLAYIAGAAIVGTIIYNASRPTIEYNPVPVQPPIIYEPISPRPTRYYDMRWVYIPECGCYRNVVVEVYR